MCSSSKTESVASPATMAIGLFLNVVEWTIARSIELYVPRRILSLVSIAPTGMYPPESALEMVMMSGVSP